MSGRASRRERVFSSKPPNVVLMTFMLSGWVVLLQPSKRLSELPYVSHIICLYPVLLVLVLVVIDNR